MYDNHFRNSSFCYFLWRRFLHMYCISCHFATSFSTSALQLLHAPLPLGLSRLPPDRRQAVSIHVVAIFTTIARMLKHLSAMNLVAETGTDSYSSTPHSKALTEPRYRDGIIYKSVTPTTQNPLLPLTSQATTYPAQPSTPSLPSSREPLPKPHQPDRRPFLTRSQHRESIFRMDRERPEVATCFNN